MRSTTAKTATFAPMHKANTSVAVTANDGFLRSMRSAKRKLRDNASTHARPLVSRTSSLTISSEPNSRRARNWASSGERPRETRSSRYFSR